ncbi:DUF6479 family protein, partial [Streptomyces mesophilus]
VVGWWDETGERNLRGNREVFSMLLAASATSWLMTLIGVVVVVVLLLAFWYGRRLAAKRAAPPPQPQPRENSWETPDNQEPPKPH